jgi:hypothetical protein
VFKKIGISERDPVEIVNKYFKECIQDNPVELEWKRALRIINDWTISEAWKFEDGSKELKYDVVGKITFEYIDIIGTEFTKKMKECGFSPTAIRQALYQNEISVCKSARQDGNYTVTVNYNTTAGVRIIRKAMERELQLSEDLPDWLDEHSKKVLDTVNFICKMRGSASLQQVQDIVGYSHKLELSAKPFLSELEYIGYITVNENGEYVSNVLENI